MTTNRADFAAIAHEGGPEALTLVAELMAHNAEASASLSNTVLANVERERDEWQQRAETAERTIARMERNVLDMLYQSTPEDWESA